MGVTGMTLADGNPEGQRVETRPVLCPTEPFSSEPWAPLRPFPAGPRDSRGFRLIFVGGSVACPGCPK